VQIKSDHWKKDGTCDCEIVGKCCECGADCTDHDLVGNQIELGFPVLWCADCMNKAFDELAK